MKLRMICAASLALVGSPCVSFAEDANTLSFGASFQSFHYAEFPDDVRLRNKETGTLPGVAAALTFAPGSWRIGLGGSIHRGEVDYDGATSSFNPHRTRTDTQIYDGVVSLGYAFPISERVSLTPFIGSGYRYWRRDIQPNNGVSGLLENYHWFYGVLGLATQWQASEKLSIGIDVRLIRPINPQLDVKFTPEVTLDLESRTGYRVAIPLRWSMTKHFGLSLAPFYEHQEFGASAPKGGFLEPSSDSRVFGFRLSGQVYF